MYGVRGYFVIVLCLLLLVQPVTGTTLLDGHQMLITPEDRSGFHNSTTTMRIWVFDYDEVPENSDEVRLEILIKSTPVSLEMTVGFNIVGHTRYSEIDRGEGLVWHFLSNTRWYGENDSVVYYFQWKLLEEFDKQWLEDFENTRSNCAFVDGGCYVIAQYSIFLQFTSLSPIWNNTVELEIDLTLGDRTRTITPEERYIVELNQNSEIERAGAMLPLTTSLGVIIALIVRRRSK